jgi:hypothetical protein
MPEAIKRKKTHRKSRFGCISCKKLRIKCDENKPTCEYCAATKRACVYLAVPTNRSQLETGSKSPEKDSDREDSLIPTTDLSSGSSSSPEQRLHMVGRQQDPRTGLSILSKLNESEVRGIEFFIAAGSTMCALGDPRVAEMWRTNGIQMALQSDAVLCGMMSIATYVMSAKNLLTDSRLPSMYFQRAVANFRHQISLDKSRHCPEELVLATTLIWAFSLTDIELLPLIDYQGGVDLVGIAQGSTAVFAAYHEVIASSFARVLLIRGTPDKQDEPTVVRDMEFLTYLNSNIHCLVRNGRIDTIEADVYYETLDLIGHSCWLAEQQGYLYPLVVILGDLSQQFTHLVRQCRPVAVILMCFVSAIYRCSMFIYRNEFDLWDRYMSDAYQFVPEDLQFMLHSAFRMSRGLEFSRDAESLLGLRNLG